MYVKKNLGYVRLKIQIPLSLYSNLQSLLDITIKLWTPIRFYIHKELYFFREYSIWIWHRCDCNLPWLIPRHWWPDSESSSYIPIPHLLDCLRHVHFWQPCLLLHKERERQRKSRSLFAAAKKKQLKVSPKDKSWGGIRASLPFCVYMCLFCCDLHYFNPFTVQIILHPAQEHKQMQKRPKIMSMTQKLR